MPRKKANSSTGTAVIAVGAAAGVLGIIGAALWPRNKSGAQISSEVFTPLDIEALARMFASENPRGSEQLKIEQAWTQLRSRSAGQSLYNRITGGSGWGKQGGRRPVATVEEATAEGRALAAKILNGTVESMLTGARQFFEPDQQDKAFRVAEVARAKKKRGEALSDQEKRLLGYQSDADGIRRRWSAQGYRKVDEVDGVEFWT